MERLIAEAGALISYDADKARDTAQLAVDAAESLHPTHPRLAFMANFYLMVSCMLLNSYSEAFPLAIKLIAMSDDPALDLGENEHLILFAYTACAVVAVERPAVQGKALETCSLGLERYAHTRSSHLLYFKHEYSKLLMASGQYSKAAAYAKQLIAEKMNCRENGQCNLDCYQTVYAQALAFAFSHQRAIAYLNGVIPQQQQSDKLWHARAWLHFKAGDFAAALSDSHAAKHISNDAKNHLLNAYAHIMLGRGDEASEVLASLCTLDPDNANAALWFSLLSGDMKPMKKFSRNKGWAHAITRFVQDEIPLEQLIELSKREDTPSHCLATAFCFAGFQAHLQGSFEQAREYYKQCLAYGHPMFDDYLWAEVNLAFTTL